MTPKLTHPNPNILVSGEGESHQLLTHTVVWKITTEDTNSRYAMFEMTDTVGGSAPAHNHPWEETFYILEGELDIQIGDRYATIGAGAVAHFPANVVHAFKIVSPVARVLIVVSPTIAEAFYREAGARITSFPPDPIVVQEMCEKYNLQPQ